jgi:hypothetical protein
MTKDGLLCRVGADRQLALLALVMLALPLALVAPSAAQETWTPTSTLGAPSARMFHTAVWTGSKMIIWGGLGVPGELNTGGIYDPETNTWTPTSTANAPTARWAHTAVWTGSKMIIWGGGDVAGDVSNTGGVYDPETNTWTPTSTANAPTARCSHAAVWTGSKMIVWSGMSGRGLVDTGGIYDLTTDTWIPTATATAPTARYFHTAVWTGSKMIVWGGLDDRGTGYSGGIYDPATDAWTSTATGGAPTYRYAHTAIWTGSRMIIWGGKGEAGDVDTGGIYDPEANTWTGTSTANAPSARSDHTAIWTGSKMIIWGGDSLLPLFFNSGGIYDLVSDLWTPTSDTGPDGRWGHTAVWTGSRMIIWGGQTTSGGEYFLTDTGGVYSNPGVLPHPPPPTDFFTVMPCRLVDTRSAAGPRGGPALVAGAIRSFPVTGGVCGIPSTAITVAVNLTVVRPTAQGHLKLYPGDAASPPLTSSINFAPGVARANNAIVALATNGGTINVKNGSAGAVHFVLDVNGYFDCIPSPCPVPLAIYLRVTSAAGGPVPGLTVDLVGSRSGTVQCNVEETQNRCVVPGGYGTYQLRVAAPGFHTADLTVVVPGSDATRCHCGTVQTQELEVILVPS